MPVVPLEVELQLPNTSRAIPLQTKSVDFMWMSRKAIDDQWLISELLPLAGSGTVSKGGKIVRSMSSRKGVRDKTNNSHGDTFNKADFGCNVRISVRVKLPITAARVCG